jgi:hypothetical protein
MSALRRIFWFGGDIFDPSHRYETSWLVSPWVLFGIRAFIVSISFQTHPKFPQSALMLTSQPQSFYAFTVLIFALIWVGVQPSYGGGSQASLSFSYFTILTYWGLAFYFLFAAIHTFTYARSGTPLLSRWPRPLQALHALYYTTIVVYPFVVTIVFWAVLFSAWWNRRYYQWSNISEHAMNSLFALTEIFLPRTTVRPWIHLLWLIVILACYLGLAYLTHYTRGVYVYGFLDPADGKGKLVGYVFGILAGVIVIFLIVQGVIWLRKWLTEKKWGREGKFHGGRAKGQGDADLEAVRMWEK